jgi:hypothetical protein
LSFAQLLHWFYPKDDLITTNTDIGSLFVYVSIYSCNFQIFINSLYVLLLQFLSVMTLNHWLFDLLWFFDYLFLFVVYCTSLGFCWYHLSASCYTLLDVCCDHLCVCHVILYLAFVVIISVCHIILNLFLNNSCMFYSIPFLSTFPVIAFPFMPIPSLLLSLSFDYIIFSPQVLGVLQ